MGGVEGGGAGSPVYSPLWIYLWVLHISLSPIGHECWNDCLNILLLAMPISMRTMQRTLCPEFMPYSILNYLRVGLNLNLAYYGSLSETGVMKVCRPFLCVVGGGGGGGVEWDTLRGVAHIHSVFLCLLFLFVFVCFLFAGKRMFFSQLVPFLN